MPFTYRIAAVTLALFSFTAVAQAQEPPLEPESVDTVPVAAEAPPAPVADDLTYPYTFVAARIFHAEFDRDAADGYGVEGSYRLLPEFYAVAAFTIDERDDVRSTESDRYELGLGYLRRLPWWDLDLNASVRLLQLDRSTRSRLEQGYRAELGVRAMPLRWLESPLANIEGAASLAYEEIDRDNETFLKLAALYPVLPALNVGVELSASGDRTAYGILGRWAF